MLAPKMGWNLVTCVLNCIVHDENSFDTFMDSLLYCIRTNIWIADVILCVCVCMCVCICVCVCVCICVCVCVYVCVCVCVCMCVCVCVCVCVCREKKWEFVRIWDMAVVLYFKLLTRCTYAETRKPLKRLSVCQDRYVLLTILSEDGDRTLRFFITVVNWH